MSNIAIHPPKSAPSIHPVSRTDGFAVVGSERGLGYNVPQRMGRRLWLPMFGMALGAWAVGFVLAVIEAGTARTAAEDLQNLGHLVPGFMFIGFLSVFAAITFAIARILGVLRNGGGEVQERVGAEVQTLKMPGTAKLMMVLMMMGMMVMAAGILINFASAASYDGAVASDLIDSARAAAAATGLRRLGVALYLTGIAFGLGTIVEVLRFQSVRVRELAAAHGRRP